MKKEQSIVKLVQTPTNDSAKATPRNEPQMAATLLLTEQLYNRSIMSTANWIQKLNKKRSSAPNLPIIRLIHPSTLSRNDKKWTHPHASSHHHSIYVNAYLCWRRYWAICIWLGEPVIVIIRSLDPGKGSSIVIPAPESDRILRILAPPFPMIAPANWRMTQTENFHTNITDTYVHTCAFLFSPF
jgi:hypothetical protein